MYHHQHLPPAASVPKPWTGSSNAKRQWAPIRAPTPKQTLPTSSVATAHNGGAVSETYAHTSPSMSKEPELQAGGGIASTASIPVPVARPTIQEEPELQEVGRIASTASGPDTQRNKGLIRFALNDPQELQETGVKSIWKEPEIQTCNGVDSTDGITKPATTPRLQAGAHAPKKPESLEAALQHESSLSISGDKTSAAPNKSSKNNLNSALDCLDSILNDFPPEADSSKDSTNMSLSASKNQDEDDNNNKANTEALDDLTRQLMEALDTNEVVGWKEAVDQIPTPSGTPFGNCASCKSAIDGEASVVGSAHYHPKCFTCAECNAPLGTEKYYIIGGKNYCSNCRYVSCDFQ